MRKLLIIAAASCAALASPALAQSSTGTVDINGSVAGRCLFTTPNATISLGELALGGSGSTAGKLDVTRVNGQTRTLIGWCNNTAATMSVTTTQLTNPAATVTGFDNRVDYTATAVANAASAADTSLTAGAGTASTVGMFTGNVVVTLSAASSPTNGLLVAGSYTGNVVVTLTPTIALPPG
jgi:hypothetical protein